MEHPYIRNIFLKLLACLCLSLAVLSCSAQLAGRYQQLKGNERLLLQEDKTFICLRDRTQRSDVVVPLCDTLASGVWEQQAGFIVLKNAAGFNRMEYAVREAEGHSADSVYFRIVLPEEDALNYANFKFSIITSPLRGRLIKFDQQEFAVSKTAWGNVTFGMHIQNIAPNADFNRKAHQRVYFQVFDGYRPAAGANMFTITIKNFNQCFYEAMDIDGDVIGIDGKNLFWRGNTYKKMK